MAKTLKMKPRLNKKGKQSKADIAKALKGGKRTPRTPPLPGMDDMRIKPLDDICASISDTRGQQNDLRAEEAGLEQAALDLMRKYQKTAWQYSGVELVRVPGEEKLRVRTSRNKATAKNEDPTDATDTDEPIGEEFAE